MKHKPAKPDRKERPVAAPQPTLPAHGPALKRTALQTPPAEPAEVLGRHKNTGQKDHKGAR